MTDMLRYTCTKCGESMTTKAIPGRSQFCSDQTAAIMTNITNVITTVQENGLRKVVIEFPWSDTEELLGQPNDALEMECVKLLRELSDDTVRHWLCDHKWKEEGA